MSRYNGMSLTPQMGSSSRSHAAALRDSSTNAVCGNSSYQHDEDNNTTTDGNDGNDRHNKVMIVITATAITVSTSASWQMMHMFMFSHCESRLPFGQGVLLDVAEIVGQHLLQT